MKKIKLPLEMANGVLVRTLDELKENWDLEKVINYYLNGKLLTWLNDRYYTELAEEVAALNGINDNAELQKKLCGIFGIEAEDNFVDLEAVAERNRRLEILRQYTADDAVLKNVDKVAFNQEELADLLDEGEDVIYLCDNKFSVPLSVTGKKYIGLGDVEIQVNSKDFVDFVKIGIELVNVHFNKEYEELVNSNVVLYKKGEELEAAEKYTEALEMYKKAGAMGNSKGLFKAGKFYHEGRVGIEVNYELAREYYEKAISLNNNKSLNNLANLYANGKGVKANISKAMELYKQAAETGLTIAMCNLGNIYSDVNSKSDGFRNYNIAINWYKQAIELGNNDALALLGKVISYGLGNREEGCKLFIKAASLGSGIGCEELGEAYEKGYGIVCDENKAIEYYKKAINLGRAYAAYRIGEVYFYKDCYEEAIKYYKYAEIIYNKNSVNNDAMYIGYAISNLAYMYERGYGTAVNIVKACELYKKSFFEYKNIDARSRTECMWLNASYENRRIIENMCGYFNGWDYGEYIREYTLINI